MILALVPPTFAQGGEVVTIQKVYVREGDQIGPGSKLFDCIVDLSGTNPHDCPPATLYRITAREKGWLRKLGIAPGHVVEGVETLGLLSTEQGEPLEQAAARNARLTIAAILHDSLW